MSRAKTAEIWWSQPNTVMRTEMFSVALTYPGAFESCARAIRNGEYVRGYDYDGDGVLTPADYNLMYDTCFAKWDAWHNPATNPYGVSTFDVRALIAIKKILAGSKLYEEIYDLDADGVVSEIDERLARFWILVCEPDKPVRDTFADLL